MHCFSLQIRCGIFAGMLIAFVFGCSTWKTTGELPGLARLPQTRMSKNSVGVEIATVTFDTNNSALLDQILLEVDEQVIDPTHRRHLSVNGIVGGSVGMQLPSAVQLMLMESADRRERPTAANQIDEPDQQRFVQIRAGKERQVPLWPAVNRLSLIHHDGDLDSPELFNQAKTLFSLRCKPSGSNTAMVTLTPKIQHGQLRQQYVAGENSFHMAEAQESIHYDDLAMSVQIGPGETLLFTCNQRAGRMGQSLFRNADGTRQKILLIRLAQTQVELSFEEE